MLSSRNVQISTEFAICEAILSVAVRSLSLFVFDEIELTKFFHLIVMLEQAKRFKQRWNLSVRRLDRREFRLDDERNSIAFWATRKHSFL